MQHDVRSDARTDARLTPGRDLGVSFIELLVAIVLLGTAGVAVLVSMSAAAVGARTSDEIADVQALLAEALVAVADADSDRVPYVACNSGTDPLESYSGAVDAEFDRAGSDVDVVAVRYWDPATETFGTSCGYGSGDRLQEIEILATAGVSSRSGVVVKRPSSAPTAGLGSIPAPPDDPIGPGFADVEMTPGIDG